MNSYYIIVATLLHRLIVGPNLPDWRYFWLLEPRHIPVVELGDIMGGILFLVRCTITTIPHRLGFASSDIFPFDLGMCTRSVFVCMHSISTRVSSVQAVGKGVV